MCNLDADCTCEMVCFTPFFSPRLPPAPHSDHTYVRHIFCILLEDESFKRQAILSARFLLTLSHDELVGSEATVSSKVKDRFLEHLCQTHGQDEDAQSTLCMANCMR